MQNVLAVQISPQFLTLIIHFLWIFAGTLPTHQL